MCWPVLIVVLAEPVPVTAGRPYSRQTIAAWDIMPPISVTVPLILAKTGAQLGAVTRVTRISPLLDVGQLVGAAHHARRSSTTLARRPSPVIVSVCSPPWSHWSTRSLVMP